MGMFGPSFWKNVGKRKLYYVMDRDGYSHGEGSLSYAKAQLNRERRRGVSGLRIIRA